MPPGQRLAGACVGRDELREAQVRLARRDRLQVVQRQRAELWMVEPLEPELSFEHLVAAPQLTERRAALERRR